MKKRKPTRICKKLVNIHFFRMFKDNLYPLKFISLIKIISNCSNVRRLSNNPAGKKTVIHYYPQLANFLDVPP